MGLPSVFSLNASCGPLLIGAHDAVFGKRLVGSACELNAQGQNIISHSLPFLCLVREKVAINWSIPCRTAITTKNSRIPASLNSEIRCFSASTGGSPARGDIRSLAISRRKGLIRGTMVSGAPPPPSAWERSIHILLRSGTLRLPSGNAVRTQSSNRFVNASVALAGRAVISLPPSHMRSEGRRLPSFHCTSCVALWRRPS